MEEDYDYSYSAAEALPQERAAFIRRTYTHVALAVAAFALTETFFFVSGVADVFIGTLRYGGRLSWLVVLGAFMGISWIADRWARSDVSVATQYLGLAVYVVAEAFIFIPMIAIAAAYGGSETISKAGIVAIGLFLGLTGVVFLTRVDFSFLRSILAIGGMVALATIVASVIFGFTLGSLFAFIMVGFAATSILYNTSNVLNAYRPTQHVAASLTLFASIALLFWYLLSIFSSDD